jgi:indolepyruvate ferredoxin oxidoreductase beta subunit
VGVISGQITYPSDQEIRQWITELSDAAWFIDATDKAVSIGAPILGNVIMAGALAGTGELPLLREAFEMIMTTRFSGDKLEQNLEAFDYGVSAVNNAMS